MAITIRKEEDYRIWTWDFVDLDQAIQMAKKQTGRVYVIEDESLVWENDEAVTWKHPKKITACCFRNGTQIKTMIKVMYNNIVYKHSATRLVDVLAEKRKDLSNQGFSETIQTSREVPANVGSHLTVGVFIFDGDVDLTSYISKATPSRMQ